LKDLLISKHEKVQPEKEKPENEPLREVGSVNKEVTTIDGNIGFSSPFLKDQENTKKVSVSLRVKANA
jgi:hypothetical protein